MRPRRVRFAAAFGRSYQKFPAEMQQMIDTAVQAFIQRSRGGGGGSGIPAIRAQMGRARRMLAAR